MAKARWSQLVFCGVVLVAVMPVMGAYDTYRWLRSKGLVPAD
jgi:hypothetical protein